MRLTNSGSLALVHNPYSDHFNSGNLPGLTKFSLKVRPKVPVWGSESMGWGLTGLGWQGWQGWPIVMVNYG